MNVPERALYPKFLGQSRIEFIEKDVPAPQEGELLIRSGANALCGSERNQFNNGSDITPGHEMAGIVAAAGKGTKIKEGTKGVVFLMGYCGRCRSCKAGYTNQCLDKKADIGFSRDGGYGPYIVIDEKWFFPVDSNVNHGDATLLLDIMGTGGHALNRAGLIRKDYESIVVAGAGPIGLGVLAMSKLTLGKKIPVFVSDVIPYRLNLVEKLGGIPVDVKKTPLETAVREKIKEGADLAVDTSGKSAARVSCMKSLAQRGTLVCVGHGENLDLNVSRDMIGPERAVLGSEYFAFSEFRENYRLFRANLEYLSRIITHRFPVKELKKAFEIFFGGETGKVIVEQEAE